MVNWTKAQKRIAELERKAMIRYCSDVDWDCILDCLSDDDREELEELTMI